MGPAPKCHFVPKLPSWNPEFFKIRTPTTLGPITLCVNLRLKWGLKQSCSPQREFPNSMWHATCTQRNQGDSWFWQFDFRPSFGHNLCFKSPNGSCKPILDIYVPRAFQCYKEPFNTMSFGPCNCLLKIWESIGTPTPKVGIWRFIPSHSFALFGTWNVTLGLTLGPHLCKPLLWLQTQGWGYNKDIWLYILGGKGYPLLPWLMIPHK